MTLQGDTDVGSDRFGPTRLVADAVLYEGYLLYPYRASAIKNRIRWQFGVVGPSNGPTAKGEPATMATTLLLEEARAASDVPHPRLWVQIRFLRLCSRRAGEPRSDGAVASRDPHSAWEREWDEGVEHAVDVGPMDLVDLIDGGPAIEHFHASPELSREEDRGSPPGSHVVRELRGICGTVRVAADALPPDPPTESEVTRLVRVRIGVDNDSVAGETGPLAGSFLGLHVLAATDTARFVSLMDPPDRARRAAESCREAGRAGAGPGAPEGARWYPVLADEDDRVALSSPIILPDHPEVAPESPGDLFDSTEIDELLALRVLTLTPEEKREARATDPRAARILDRCEELTPEALGRLHGAVRTLRPAAEPQTVPWWDPESEAGVDPESDGVMVGDTRVGKGTRVRLVPGGGADAQDIFLAGRPARVAAVFRDVDEGVHVAVVLEDDPASDLHGSYGRYRYFRPAELEPLGPDE